MDNNIDELQELKAQYNLLAEELKKQKIINENNIKEGIKQNVSNIDNWYKFSLFAYVIALVLWNLLLIFPLSILSWQLLVFGDVMMLSGAWMSYKSYKALHEKDFRSVSMKDALMGLEKYKKQQADECWVGYGISIVFVGWLLYESRSDTFIILTILLVVLPSAIISERNMRKKLKELEAKIRDLKQGEE